MGVVEKEAVNGGDQCHGDEDQEEACHQEPCPIDCEWSDWSVWSQCTRSMEMVSSTVKGPTQSQRCSVAITAQATFPRPCPATTCWSVGRRSSSKMPKSTG